MKMKEFDLFKLHAKEDTTPRSWICASGKNLHKKLSGIIEELIKNKGYIIVNIKVKKEIIQEIYNKAILKAGNQQNLAKILEVQRQNLYKWKECKRRIPLSVLNKLIDYSKRDYKIQEIGLGIRKHTLGLNKQKIAKLIAKKLNTRLSFTERIIYGKRKEVALIFILELLTLWKNLLNKSNKDLQEKKQEIKNTLEFFKQNTNKGKIIGVVYFLTPMFSKIVGAMLADGCITASDNSLSIIDEDKKNIENFSDWIKDLFCMSSTVKKHKKYNAWYVKIDNKIIQRYFTEFFKFNKGKKRKNYSIPHIIKNSSFNIQKACVCGVMAFDGMVRINKEIGLNIGSRRLRDDIFRILIKDGLNVSKLSKQDSTGMWRLYSSRKFDKDQYRKWLDYFFEGSNKWIKIYEFINGFNKKVSTVEEALTILERAFKSASASKVDLTFIFKMFTFNNSLTTKQILFSLKRKDIRIREETLWLYLNILREMNIVKKEREGNMNIYFLNKDINEWLLPNRL